MPIHGGKVTPAFHCTLDLFSHQHRWEVAPRSTCSTCHAWKMQRRSTDRPTSVHVPRTFQHSSALHRIGHVRPLARRTSFSANQARGVDRGIDRRSRLGKGFGHPWRHVARGGTKPTSSLVTKRLLVGCKGPFYRCRQARRVFRPSAPSAMARAVAGEGQPRPTTSCKVDQGLSSVWVVELVLNDEDGDRMTCLLDPVTKAVNGGDPCFARLARGLLTTGILASRGVPLPPRSVVGIVGVHGQPGAAHASPPPTWIRWRW